MQDQGVTIIGGGIAGLTAGLRMARAGKRVVLLEARERLGGRLLTRITENGTPIEMGAEFIHGAKTATWEFLRESGLETEPVTDRHWKRTPQGSLEEEQNFWDKLEKVSNRFEEVKEDTDFLSFINSQKEIAEDERTLATSYVEGFHAAELDRVSVRSLARSENASEEDEGNRQFRLRKGYSALADWMAQELRKQGALILVNRKVRNIEWRPGRVLVSCEGTEPIESRQALITLPVGVMQREATEPGGVRFEPDLPEKRATARRIASGDVAKLVLCFAENCWPVNAPGFVHAPDLDFLAYWPNENGTFVTCWAGGRKAQRLLESQGTSLRDQGLACVAKLLQSEARRVAQLLEGHHFHNWTEDACTLGTYSYTTKGSVEAPRELAQPVANTLFFAGEATMSDGRQGTVHGAILSGTRAAEAMLQDKPGP
jgi:monoamine oxidase